MNPLIHISLIRCIACQRHLSSVESLKAIDRIHWGRYYMLRQAYLGPILYRDWRENNKWSLFRKSLAAIFLEPA